MNFLSLDRPDRRTDGRHGKIQARGSSTRRTSSRKTHQFHQTELFQNGKPEDRIDDKHQFETAMPHKQFLGGLSHFAGI